LKILVIEDNPDIKEVLEYILQDEGHDVVRCSDGSSLCNLDQIKPNIILMDEVLGGLRGSDLIKKLKADENTSSTPVVLISAMPNLKDIAARCGADAFLEKPFNIDNLTDIIKTLS
jgi:two-component system phosphate regulon response regulator PhoB